MPISPEVAPLSRSSTEFDPLRSPESKPSTPTPSTSRPITSPLSFKRRVPSRGFRGSISERASLLSGILNRNNVDQQDKLPSAMTLTSDDEEGEENIDEDEEDDGESEIGAYGRGVRNRTASRATGRSSFNQRRNPTLNAGNDNDGEVTPLPVLPMIVLCICMFSEFLSASTAAPFIVFMVKDFQAAIGEVDESTIAFWSAVVASCFFLAQFLTSLLWVSIAEKHGRRAVLFSSMCGNSITLILFGCSRNLRTAIAVRLGQGLFSGAIGVARGGVRTVTNRSNEGYAFTLISTSWSVGGIIGSCIGGLTEHPVQNLPYFFGDSILFNTYPYLLPCLMSGSITLLGAILSLFLDRDGGSRTGSIRLPSEKEVESAISVPRRWIQQIATCFPHRRSHTSLQPPRPDTASIPTPSETMDIRRDERNPIGLARTSTKQNGYGSAYGYTITPRTPRGNAYGFGARMRKPSGRGGMRSFSVATSTRYAPDYDDIEHQDLNFAQRLLLANEGAVFSLSDLWVANEREEVDHDQNEDDEGETSVFEDDDSRIDDNQEEPEFFGFGTAPPSLEDIRSSASQQRLGKSPSLAVPFDALYGRQSSRTTPSRIVSGASMIQLPPFNRRPSVAFSVRGPSIFSNTGLNPSSLASAALLSPKALEIDSPFNTMDPIPERAIGATTERDAAGVKTPTLEMEEAAESPAESAMSLLRQLPLAFIAQYSLLALHNTANDQVFMLFLVTPVASGGLGLHASNYAVLVSLMFVFSLLWQFQFYPNVALPRGRISHLGMFRLGLSLYLPVYLLFPELRGLLRESGNGWLFFGLTLLSSVRYLANTLAYTSLMILINATTPPHLVPLSNGLAQSAVSLSRFIGPLIGGTLFSISITAGKVYPLNYALGFIVSAGICFLGLLHSTRIR